LVRNTNCFVSSSRRWPPLACLSCGRREVWAGADVDAARSAYFDIADRGVWIGEGAQVGVTAAESAASGWDYLDNDGISCGRVDGGCSGDGEEDAGQVCRADVQHIGQLSSSLRSKKDAYS